MVDMAKKILKKSPELLNPDEDVLGACVVLPVGQFKKNVAFGAVGGAVGATIGQRVSGKAVPSPERTMAETLRVSRQSILAVTNQRWVLFEQGLMNVGAKSVQAQWTHQQIDRLDFEKSRLTSRIDVVFADGSIAQLEAVKGARPERLVEAVALV
jgi:hypothetical protein